VKTDIFTRGINKLSRCTIGRLRAGKEISRLHDEDDVRIKLLADVFADLINNRYSHEEKRWIQRIKALRDRLLTLPEKVLITDCGAGTSGSNLGSERMHQAREIVTTVGKICRSVSSSNKWSLLLFRLIREFRPLVCLELGTSLGISAAYQAAALELNRDGKIITLEGARPLALLAEKNLENLNLKRRVDITVGRFQDKLQDVLCEYAHIDFVFIDGHHDKDATLNYFRQILPFLSDGSILVFDDISWSPGMKQAWSIIHRDKNLKVSVDLFYVGVCIFTKSPVEETKTFRIAI